jgi:para-aminobenzoate synthetase / 4-amino-4-deoxychorismate lyase
MTTFPAPDPTHGLFETLLVLDGKPIALDLHLGRLERSLRALFATSLPPRLASGAKKQAHGRELGRLRIAVGREGRVTMAAEDVDPADFFPARERGAELRSLPCPTGLGAHKWADRRFLAETPAEPVPLLFDRGEEVLEAGRGNLFAVFGGVLRTPRADGRILPGTARAATIEVAGAAGAEVREGRLGREDLFSADEVFLTGSVRGVEPVRSLDGVPLPTPSGDELGAQVGESLLRRWRAGRLAAAGP